MNRFSKIIDILIGRDEEIIETQAHSGQVNELEKEESILGFIKNKLEDEQFLVFQEELRLFQEETAVEVDGPHRDDSQALRSQSPRWSGIKNQCPVYKRNGDKNIA